MSGNDDGDGDGEFVKAKIKQVEKVGGGLAIAII